MRNTGGGGERNEAKMRKRTHGENAGYKEEHGDRTERNKTRLTLVCTTRRRIDVLLIKPKG